MSVTYERGYIHFLSTSIIRFLAQFTQGEWGHYSGTGTADISGTTKFTLVF